MSAPDVEAGEARWAAAWKLAEGVPDAGSVRRRRRVLLWVTALVVGSMLIGVAVALAVPGPRRHPSAEGLSPWDVLGFAVTGVGFLVALAGFFWARRTGRYITRWRYVTSPLAAAERKSVMKQIRGKHDLDLVHRDVVIAAARQMRRGTEGVLPLWAGLALMSLGQLIRSHLWIVTALAVVALALFAIAGIAGAWDYRRFGTFLRNVERQP